MEKFKIVPVLTWLIIFNTMYLPNISEVLIMSQTNINICMDDTLKQQFDHLCNELGLNMSVAVNIFAKAMVRQQKIPFEVSLDIPNAETLEAINDVNHERNLSRPFHSIEELMEDLNA